jgi:hypothetical protein
MQEPLPDPVFGRNFQEFDWDLTHDGSLAGLHQKLRIGAGQGRQVVDADFDAAKAQTDIRVRSPRAQPLIHNISPASTRCSTVLRLTDPQSFTSRIEQHITPWRPQAGSYRSLTDVTFDATVARSLAGGTAVWSGSS